MTSVTADLLSAASLLTAIIAIFFALWSPDIGAALKKAVPANDKHLEREAILKVLRWRALPLCVASIALTGILVPPAVAVVVEAIRIADGGNYDAVKACYIVMIVLLFGLSCLSIVTVVQLARHAKRFE
jgi:hypothetical protein